MIPSRQFIDVSSDDEDEALGNNKKPVRVKQEQLINICSDDEEDKAKPVRVKQEPPDEEGGEEHSSSGAEAEVEEVGASGNPPGYEVTLIHPGFGIGFYRWQFIQV